MKTLMPHDVLDLFELGMDRTVEPWIPISERSLVLNLGCGQKTFPWAVNMDQHEPADVTWLAGTQMPQGDSTVEAILAFHFLEHLDQDHIYRTLRECYRVLMLGGTLNIVVPYGVSDCALQDLDHKTRFMEDTWKNTFRNGYYKKLPWPKFSVGFNMIMGLNHRNLVLVSQLVKEA